MDAKIKTEKISLHDRFEEMNARLRAEFLEAISERCDVHESTVYRWINGVTIPTILEQKEIAIYLGDVKENIFF